MHALSRLAVLLLLIITSLLVVSAQHTSARIDPRAQQVVSFTLVNADDDVEVGQLRNGDVIDCAFLKTRTLNIRAHTSPSVVGSVRFSYDSNPNFNIESTAPYFLTGNNGADWNGWTPTDGTHTLTATPYTGKNGTGSAGTALTLTFSAASCTTTPTDTPTGTLPTSTPQPFATPTFSSSTTPVGSHTPAGTTTPGGSVTVTITSLPTLTNTAEVTPQTETPTGFPSTPDITPIPTEILSIELLSNRSFEEDADGNDVPDYWLQKMATKDRRKCNKDRNGDGIDDKILASDGRCMYQFKSSPGENSKLMQKLGVSGPTTVTTTRISTGDSLMLRGEVYTKGTNILVKVKLRVKYRGANPPPKGKLTMTMTNQTADYQPLSGNPVLMLSAEPDWIKVQIQNRGTSGKVRVDNMSLILDRRVQSNPLPLPSVP